MTRRAPDRDPLTDVTRVLVDGSNLLHALANRTVRPANAAGPQMGPGPRLPPSALIGRLRAVIPAETAIELVFDGPAEPGLRGERIAHGVSVRYSGRYTADTILITLVEEVAVKGGAMPGGGSPASDALLVITDDRDLRGAVTRRGARTAGTLWLLRRMERPRLSAPSVGNARPPKLDQGPPGRAVDRDGGGDRPGWSPGRGATRKRGNGKPAPKSKKPPKG
jgi:hypothetical protein